MSDRIGRLEFIFWFVTAIVVGSILLGIVMALTNTPTQFGGTYPLSSAACLILAAVIILRASVSRFHDMGRPGWSALLLFVPLIGVIAFVLLLAIPGQKGPNRFGEPSVFLQRLRKVA
jgi:uncharacterized membrane protein YhaH (DUF805 family)